MTTIMVTGASDGLGLASAQRLADLGHQLVLHGRDESRLDDARSAVEERRQGAVAGTAVADLSDLSGLDRLADEAAAHGVAVLVNNAGVLRTGSPVTDAGLDVRFAVNAIAPYRLTRRLLPALPADGRVVNLSSAAQTPVDLDALAGRAELEAMDAYAQSKLALTMWSRHLADELGPEGPAVIALNPGSLLATRMVREGFGVDGNDIGTGADVISRAAVDAEFADATGRYYDNDAGAFGEPHADALDERKNADLVRAIDDVLARVGA